MAPIAITPTEEEFPKSKPWPIKGSGGENNSSPPLDDENAPVPFGSGPDQWLYLPSTKRFDLSRGSRRKLTIDADDGVRYHRGCIIDPNKTCLVIVDMQNFFIHPEFCDHAGGLKAIPPTLKVIERCRQQGIQIIWLNWGIDDWNLQRMPPAVQRAFCRKRYDSMGHGWHVRLGAEMPDGQGRCLWKGSWSAQIYDPLLQAADMENDLFFDKDRPSGMWHEDEPLRRYMRESGKKTMLFTGVNTDQCVLGTLTDSYSNGYDCILISDCAGTMTGLMAQEVCDYNVATNYGFVTDSDAFLNATYE
ncbi:MAG: hypothetical protein M1831_000644 [Alyxoria varia]|nr:MAG: hypothetical protein M1831_000644 [Alyxoria varia]